MGQVVGKLQTVQKEIEKTSNKGWSLSRTLKAAFAAYALYGLTRFTQNLIDTNIETLEFSKRIGASVRTVQMLDFAITQTGHPVESLRNALSELAVTMQEARLGNIHAINSFKLLGITVADLDNKSPTAIFTKIAEQISNIRNPAQQAAVAFRFWGKEAVHLLPLLQMGAEGIAKAGERARMMGLILDNDKLEKLKAGRIALENLRSTLDGFVLQLATQLAPYVLTLIQLFEQWLGKNLDLEKAMKFVGVAVGALAQYIYSAFATVKIAVLQGVLYWTMLTNTVQQGTIAMEVGFRNLERAANKAMGIEGIINPQLDIDAANQIIQLQKEKDDIRLEINRLQAAVANGMVAQDIDKWFEDMNKKLAKGAAAIKKENDAINAAFIDQDIFKRGRELASKLTYPLEQFEMKMKELKFLAEKGGILPDEFGRAALKNLNELQDALGLTQVRLAGANTITSTAAVSATNQAMAEQQMRGGDDPAKRLEKMLKAGNEQRKILVENSKKTADALGDFYEVNFPK